MGGIIYFAFIRKADEVAEAVSDPTMSGGTSGGVGGSPAGAQGVRIPTAAEKAQAAATLADAIKANPGKSIETVKNILASRGRG